MEENFKEEAVDKNYMSLYSDVDYLRDQLSQVSAEIIKNDVSKYPVFIAHQEELSLGKPLFSRTVDQTNNSISVTILEELVNKQIVSMEKVDEFRKVYKTPDKFFCFLVIIDEKMQFIFIKK